MKKVLLLVNKIEEDYSSIINDFFDKGIFLVMLPFSKKINISNINADSLMIEEDKVNGYKEYHLSSVKKLINSDELSSTIKEKLTLAVDFIKNNKESEVLIGSIKDMLVKNSVVILDDLKEKVLTNVEIVTDFYSRHNNEKYVAYIRKNKCLYISRLKLIEGNLYLYDIEDRNVIKDIDVFSISLKIVLGIISKEQDLNETIKTVLNNTGFIVDGDNPNLQSLHKVISRENYEIKIY